MAFTTIRVVEAARALADPATTPPEELAILLESWPPSALPLRAFVEIAERMQMLRPSRSAHQNTQNVDTAIAARMLFLNPMFGPVIRGKFADKYAADATRVRPATRVEAGIEGSSATIGVAAEEPIAVVGVRRTRDMSLFAGRTPLGMAAMRASGAYAAPALAALEFGAQRIHGPKTEKMTPANVQRLLTYAIAFGDYIDMAPVRPEASSSESIMSAVLGNTDIGAPKRAKHADYHVHSAAIVYLMGRLAKTGLLSLAPVPYTLAPLYDFYRLGALGVYQYLLAAGRESEEVDNFLSRAAMMFEKERQWGELSRRATARALQTKQFELIIAARGLTPVRRPVPGQPLAALHPRDAAQVLQIYDLRTKELAANLANTCPHLALVRRMRTAATAEDSLRLLKELDAFVAKPVGTQRVPTAFLRCRSCERNVVCPHVAVLVRLAARRAPYDEVRTALAPFAARGAKGSAAGDAYTYYCGICAEKLAETFEEDRAAELLGKYGSIDGELRKLIWGELAASAERLRSAAAPIDPKQYASAAVGVVYPLVLTAEENLNKQAGRRAGRSAGRVARHGDGEEEDAIAPRLHLYAVLFVYAFALDVIASSAGNLTFEGGKSANPATTAEAMLAHIMTNRKGIISQITDITPEFISARFTEAYRMVRGHSGAITMGSANPEEELAIQLTQFIPAYNYAAVAGRVMGALRFDAPVAREFETVMGVSLPDLVKRIRENAKVYPAMYSRRMLVDIPADTEVEFMAKDPKINMFVHMYKGHGTSRPQAAKGAGFRFAPLRANPLLAGVDRAYFEASYRLFVEYCMISSRTARAAYEKHLASVLEAEAKYYTLKRVAGLMAQHTFLFKRSRAVFDREATPLGRLYDEDGLPHQWTTFVYMPDLVVPRKEIAAARTRGALTSAHRLVDLQCAVCGVRQAAAAALDEAKVRKSLEVANRIDLLFSFYESRCPGGELHAYGVGVAACAKCGLRAGLQRERQTSEKARLGAESRRYYEAHEGVFAAERALLTADASADASVPDTPAQNDTSVSAATHRVAAGDVSDYASLVSAAELGEVPVAVVEALGATEGRTYEEVLAGTAVPAPPVAWADARIANVQALAREFIARNARVVAAAPPTATLPTPAEQLSFEIQRLCRLALAVGDRAAWQLTLRSDKLLCKPGPFNFSIFTNADADDTVDAPIEDDAADPAGEDGAFTAFSLENMDYNGKNE